MGLVPIQDVSLPQQKQYESRPFPLVISPFGPSISLSPLSAPSTTSLPPPISSSADALQLADVTSWIQENLKSLESLLQSHGAILLRDFPIKNASDFNLLVESFGWEEFPYVGGAAPRSNVVGRVFTSNESPPDQKIPFHHEMAQVPEYPSKLFFYCEVKPGEEGETPLLLSHFLLEEMEKRRPEFVKELREKGLVYTRVLGEGDDPTSAIGRGWQSTFQTQDKKEAEKRGAGLGVSLEWQPDGSVKTVTSVLPAIRKHPLTGQETWFNSMAAAYTGWKDSRNTPEKAVTFGDGKPLPGDAVLETLKVMEEVSVAIPWQVGDVVVIDNNAVQHARKTFVPPRRVLAALTK